eukprot:1357783-Alexandrium_andersonii.AAC.1
MATRKHWAVAASCAPIATRRHARSERLRSSAGLASGVGLRTRLRGEGSIYAPPALAMTAASA